MKQIKIIALFLVLVFFPLGSWFYLQKGLDFRKDLGKELEVKGNISEFVSATEGLDIFKGKTSLFILPEAKIDSANLNDIYDQFKQAYTFQLVNANGSFNSSDFSSEKEWVNFNCDVTDPRLKGNVALIVDEKMQVRNYFGSSDEDLKSLVRQLSISFPRRPQRDIVEKKDLKKDDK